MFTDCQKLVSNTAPAQTGNRSQLQQQASIPSVPCVCLLPGGLSSSRSPRQAFDLHHASGFSDTSTLVIEHCLVGNIVPEACQPMIRDPP